MELWLAQEHLLFPTAICKWDWWMLANELIKKQGCVHDNVKPVRVMVRVRDRGSDINFMAFWCVGIWPTNTRTNQPTEWLIELCVCDLLIIIKQVRDKQWFIPDEIRQGRREGIWGERMRIDYSANCAQVIGLKESGCRPNNRQK